MIGALLVVLLVTGLTLYGWYGWRLTKRANRSKAAVVSRLLGQVATLFVQGETIVAPHMGIILRLEDDLVVVKELPNLGHHALEVRPSNLEERVFALAGIREIRQGDLRWGPW